jgi:sulfopyruvate decarboxylase TPP-binding subunit
MLDGSRIAAELASAGATDVIWIPDSTLGLWEAGLQKHLRLLRVCREGEAIALAAGLLLGGRKPVVIIQCTGLFEAGDSLRNAVHDLKLPLFLIVGVRSYFDHQRGASRDTCPVFTEPILQAWKLPYQILSPEKGVEELALAYRGNQTEKTARAVLLPE